jgi:hypothetical protein
MAEDPQKKRARDLQAQIDGLVGERESAPPAATTRPPATRPPATRTPATRTPSARDITERAAKEARDRAKREQS